MSRWPKYLLPSLCTQRIIRTLAIADLTSNKGNAVTWNNHEISTTLNCLVSHVWFGWHLVKSCYGIFHCPSGIDVIASRFEQQLEKKRWILQSHILSHREKALKPVIIGVFGNLILLLSVYGYLCQIFCEDFFLWIKQKPDSHASRASNAFSIQPLTSNIVV